MKKYGMKGIGFALLVAMCAVSMALYAATKEEARAMVRKAEAYYKANGKEKTMAEIQKNKGMFEKGEIYVYVFDFNATVLAHPKLPSWVGKSFMNLKDADGKPFIKEAMGKLKTANECWVEYKWNNPETKKIGPKISYFLKVDDFVFTSGVWK